MKIELNGFTIILIILIVLFGWLWLIKPTDVIVDNSKELELLETIRLQKIEIDKSTMKIDSVSTALNEINDYNIKLEKQFKIINTKYNEQINIINSQFVDANIRFFSTSFLSDSTSN